MPQPRKNCPLPDWRTAPTLIRAESMTIGRWSYMTQRRLEAAGELIAYKVGKVTIIDGDSFRNLLRNSKRIDPFEGKKRGINPGRKKPAKRKIHDVDQVLKEAGL